MIAARFERARNHRSGRVTLLALLASVASLSAAGSAMATGPGPGFAVTSTAFPSSFQTGDLTNATQLVYVNATGGAFTLQFGSHLTSDIPYNATADEVRAALESLEGIGNGDVSVTGGREGEGGVSRWTVTFIGALSGQSVGTGLSAHGEELTGGTHTASVSTLVEGGTARDRYVVTVTNTGSRPTSGIVTVADILPDGLTVKSIAAKNLESRAEETASENGFHCKTAPLGCTYENPMPPGDSLRIVVSVAVNAGATGSVTNSASVEGGGVVGVTSTGPPETMPNTLNGPQTGVGVQDFGFDVYGTDGVSDTQAGDHPNAVNVRFDLNTVINAEEAGSEIYAPAKDAKNVVIYLPLGMVGNPQATPQCTEVDVVRETCPEASRIGTIMPYLLGVPHGVPVGVYNLIPEDGYAAEFGFVAVHRLTVIYATVVPTSAGYMLRTASPGIIRELEATGALLTFYGDPAERNAAGNPAAAFYTNPTRCSPEPLNAKIEADSWEDPTEWSSRESPVYSEITNCDMLQFDPTLELRPETTQADTPSGYEVELKVPQAPNVFPDLATPDLKDAEVKLPEGISISPSAADGLVGCAEKGPEGIDFPTGRPHADEAGEGEELGPDGLSRPAPGHCPAKSQIGEVQITTPLLPNPLEGHVYLTQPSCGGEGQEPCTEADATNGRLYGLYLEVAGSGVIIKLKGKVSANPTTGELTTTFTENPQLPFSDLKVRLNGGPRSPLVNPQGCGTFTTMSDLVPWSSPITPDATPSSSFDIAGCATSMPFGPAFNAGTVTPIGGGFSSLTLTLSRHDGEQDLAGVSLTLPPGVGGLVSKVPLCPGPQASLGTCSEASRIGTVHAAAGAGSEPLWLEGPVYLTGSYKGAPFGLSVVVPAVAGPFNLGNVVDRATIDVNPKTAQVTVTSDPFPQIRDGVPLRLKTVNVTVDRPKFTFNPTNCSQLHVTGSVSGDMPNGSPGATVPVSSPFAAAGCKDLPFKPTFTVSTQGKTSKADGASLTVKLTSKGGPQAGGGEANIRAVKVDLPKQLPSRLTTLQKACTEAQFNANPAGCPAASNVGTASAVTPIFSHPLTGPAYFVSHGGEAFPDLEIVLQGEGVTLILDGNTDIKKGITSSTFRSVPDAPISSFELKLPAGPYSILGTNLPASANYSLCGQTLNMPTAITGQNGAVVKQTTKIGVEGCKPAITVVRHSVKGKTATIAVSVPSAGKLVATGNGLSKATGRSTAAGTVTVKLTLSKAEQAFLKKHHARRLKATIKLTFSPKKGAKLKTSTTVLIS
jgi:uncharacterized repeat protein (TIGR01451 family)